MKICIFDDSKRNQFFPLSLTRPVSYLRVGMFTIMDKISLVMETKDPPAIFTADYLMDYFSFNIDESERYFWINSRIVPTCDNLNKIKSLKDDEIVWLEDGSPGAFIGTKNDLNRLMAKENKTNLNPQVKSFSYIWDLIYANEELLQDDFRLLFHSPAVNNETFLNPDAKNIASIDPENIRIHHSAKIDPGVVLDASDGPIVIDKNARIMPNTVITGPAYIGPGTLIKSLSKIYGHVSIGPVCKIGGEVAETIIQGYSNKQHDGFLGHAYLGEWCNLGADTNNSDLKNNYGEITVYLNGKPVNTGKRFLGLIMGDHSKSAINTSFNTGTIVGIHCNIFARNFVKKYIPSFSWVGDDFIRKYHFEKAMEVAGIVMSRRKVEFTEKEYQLFKYIYEYNPEENDA